MTLEHLPNQSQEVQQIGKKLRSEVLRAIASKGLSDDELAARLDLLPTGIEILRKREDWSLEMAVRMAAAVGLSVSLRVEEKRA